MKTTRRTDGTTTYFIIVDLDPAYHDTVRSLYYSPIADGFAKRFPADTPHLDKIYQTFSRHAEEMVLQTAQVHPALWDTALLAFVRAIEDQQIDWWLTGSAALAVRGLDIAPRDLDLVVGDASAPRLGELLLDHLIEPVVPTPGWIGNCFGRAFLHARIEWVGGVRSSADTPHVGDCGPEAASRLEVVDWHGKAVRVPPLDLSLDVSARRGLTERAEKIRCALSGVG